MSNLILPEMDGRTIWRTCPASAGAERKEIAWQAILARSQPAGVACYPPHHPGVVLVLKQD